MANYIAVAFLDEMGDRKEYNTDSHDMSFTVYGVTMRRRGEMSQAFYPMHRILRIAGSESLPRLHITSD